MAVSLLDPAVRLLQSAMVALRRPGAQIALLALLTVPTTTAIAAPRIAVFDFELVDTSGESASSEQAERLLLISRELRALLAAGAEYEPVDIEPVRPEILEAGYLSSCNGCEAAIARKLGADFALVGTVHKISTLIQYISVRITDADDGTTVNVSTVSIRGNSDTAWLRGIHYLARNKL